MTAPSATLTISAYNRNWRGITTANVLYYLLDYEERASILRECTTSEEAGIEPPPSWFEGTEKEWLADHAHFYREMADAARGEMLRRREIKFTPVPTDPEIFRAIQEAIPVADVLERFTEVFYSDRKTMKYRCALHGDGQDRTPAGVIYRDENRWWCFVCNRGGDVVDAMELYAHMTKGEAVRELCRMAGIERTTVVPHKVPVLQPVIGVQL